MIIGIGCDIVEHNTTLHLNWGSDNSIQKRIFAPEELKIYAHENDVKFLAGRFAAKEAVLKCLGTGMQDGISLTDIQISQSENGKPIPKLYGGAKVIADKIGINSWHITITHSKAYSVAFALAET